jgi:hypothetical protein
MIDDVMKLLHFFGGGVGTSPYIFSLEKLCNGWFDMKLDINKIFSFASCRRILRLKKCLMHGVFLLLLFFYSSICSNWSLAVRTLWRIQLVNMYVLVFCTPFSSRFSSM